jgi:hypothetical protein
VDLHVIGKALRERHGRGALPDAEAVALLNEMLATHAALLVQVRARDVRMIACLVVRADEPALRLCRTLGFDMKPGGTGVFGLLGGDAARVFAHLPPHQRAWLDAPCATRETKVLLLASGGSALLSIEANEGNVAVKAVPRAPPAAPDE